MTQITWLLIALIWGSLRLFATRNATINQANSILEENYWGFGQCLATLILLPLPFSIMEIYTGVRPPDELFEAFEATKLLIEAKNLEVETASTSAVHESNSSSVSDHNLGPTASSLPCFIDGAASIPVGNSCVESIFPADADVTDQGIVTARMRNYGGLPDQPLVSA